MKWIVVLLTLVCLCQGNRRPPGAVCPRGFTAFRHRCYYVSAKFETFDSAESICKTGNSELAAPLTCEDHLNLNAILVHHRVRCRRGLNCDEFWIGIYNPNWIKGLIGNWKTTTEFEIVPEHPHQQWAGGERYQRHVDGNCAIMSYKDTYKHRGYWRNTNCTRKLKYVCIKCPNGFDYVPEIEDCLYFNPKKASWKDARQNCSQLKLGAQLVLIKDWRKQNAVKKFLEARTSGSTSCGNPNWPDAGNIVWIGGQTQDPNKCGTPYQWKPVGAAEIPFTYTYWYREEPKCDSNKENCAFIGTSTKYNSRWEDSSCEIEHCSVCEF